MSRSRAARPFLDRPALRDNGVSRTSTSTFASAVTRFPSARYAAAVATFWRYVRIQLIVFVFGIVGPIFLVLFFATQPEPSMKWAYWAGLFITAADVLIALALTDASGPEKAPADVRVALAAAKRKRRSRSQTGDQASHSSSH